MPDCPLSGTEATMAFNRIAKPKPKPTLRTFLPLIIGGIFAATLLIVLAIYFASQAPTGPSQQELADDTAKGLKYERGDGVQADLVQAASWYRKAAEHNYPPAALNLGIMYMSGRGAEHDDAEAVKWFRVAADGGLAEAQVQLAGNYLTGTGIAMDKVEAMKWLLLGADAMGDALSKQVAVATRQSLNAELSAAERAEAAQRAADWREQHRSAD
jgi:TPR repeat protein